MVSAMTDTLMQELREARAVIAQQAKQLERMAQQEKELQELRQLVVKLQEYTRRLLRGRYGAATEKLIGAEVSGQQLIAEVANLLSREAGNTAKPAPVAPAPVVPVSSAVAPSPKTKPRRSVPWSKRHPELPVETVELQPEPAELIDSDGRMKARIDAEVTETLRVRAASVVIQRTVRPRYASVITGGERVIAELPARITPAGRLHDDTVHWLMAQRYGWSFPFCRSLTLLGQLGISLPASTVNDVAGDWSAVMWPLARAIRRELWRSPLLFVDHAVMRQQDRDLEGKCRRIPVFVATDGHLAWYDAPSTLRNERAAEVLHGYDGTILGDDWSGWKPHDPAGCNAHARRPFAELQALSAEAHDLVARYAQLYAIEGAIRRDVEARGLVDQALWDFRVAERQRLGAPAIMDGLHKAAEAIANGHPKGTTLGNGARYLLRCWHRLIRFLTDGRLLPDNNTAERALRGIALNRKNSLFLGHGDRAADRAAIAWTIFGSCRLQRIDPMTYLNAVTPELLRWRRGLLAGRDRLPDIAHLTPSAWAAQRAKTREVAA
jgi:transposase